MFGGFGPIIAGIIFAILGKTLPGFELSGGKVLSAIVSTYLLAFIQAGASVCNQIEHWPLAKSLFVHFGILYAAYVGCYLFNGWIKPQLSIVAVFTAIFAIGYFVIWFIVCAAVKHTEKKLNMKL